MNTKSLLLLILGAALLPLASQAKPEGPPTEGKRTPPSPAKILERLDADQNGSLSKAEAKGPLAKNFDTVDADGNGKLSSDELAASQKKLREKVRETGKKLKEADTDGNGAISSDEAAEAGLEKLVEHFDKIDADGDGEVSKEEMHEMRKQHQKRERAGQEEE
jgi:Ca2+-binding EF-hand superfamily protein